MPTTVNGGRAHIAKLIKTDIEEGGAFFALGSGEPWWGQEQSDDLTLIDDVAITSYQPNLDLDFIVKSIDGATTYGNADFEVANNGRITRSPSGAIPFGAQVAVDYTAIVPNRPVTTEALINEVGRTKILNVSYVIPKTDLADPNTADINVAGGEYAISPSPTKHLLIEAVLASANAPSATVSEIGVFLGGEVDQELPAGHPFYTPAQTISPGQLLFADSQFPILIGGGFVGKSDVGIRLSLVYSI